MIKFICALIVVDEIAPSRHFYEDLLDQTVKFDFGENVTFEGDFSIHQRAHYQQLLGAEPQYPVMKKPHNAELYFETDEIELIDQRLQQAGIEYVHAMLEQPWGQRVLRVYDPDGHIVEIGEPMEVVVWRFHQQGLALEQITEKSSMPREFVEYVIQEHDASSE